MRESDEPRVVPLRRQYLDIKARFPDTILLFRLGDFYETFEEDARIAAGVLDIVLTSREMGKGQRVPLAGIPYHAAEGYIARLIAARWSAAVLSSTIPERCWSTKLSPRRPCRRSSIGTRTRRPRAASGASRSGSGTVSSIVPRLPDQSISPHADRLDLNGEGRLRRGHG